MTRNGKIARLSKVVRDELNRRIDNSEQGKSLVKWLNSLPEVQAVTSSEFGGKPIREQNLSEWKNGGYRDWQARQERHEFVRQLEQEAKEVGAVMETEAINRHLSVVLTAELALAIRDVQQIADPKERAQCLAQIVGRFAQLRRAESNASRAEIVREQWDAEVAKKEEQKRACSALMSRQALLLQQIYIDMFSRADARSLAAASDFAGSLCPEAISLPVGLAKPNPTQSD
jgi:hypothetical protein